MGKITVTNPADIEGLMNAEDYGKMVG